MLVAVVMAIRSIWQYGLWSFQTGGTKLERFLHKNQQIYKLILSQNVNNKKCAPKLVFFNEKKKRKIQMNFYIENWLWKSNFGTFWKLTIKPKLKFNNFLWLYWFLSKNIYNLASPIWKLHNPYCHIDKITGSRLTSVWCIKCRSKYSSNTVLSLLRNLMHQTLWLKWTR